MTEMDGFEAVKAIREREKITGKYTPVIAMTAHAIKEDRVKCLKAGMDDYISKPFAPEDLRELILKALCNEDLSEEDKNSNKELNNTILDAEPFMKRMGGKKNLVKNILRTCLIDLKEEFSKLAEGVETKDRKKIKFAVHSIKGAAANISAHRVRNLVYEIENSGNAGDFIALVDFMKKLEREIEELEREMEDFLAEE